jgi:hypothetical protein
MIEGGLTVIAIAVAFCWPRIGSTGFSCVERIFGKLARRQGLAVVTVGVTALLLRLAILPWSPVPYPFTPNDFSFLLAAETFASGRLTNPTPAMWPHFESIHITMQPSYMSMYFPSNGLVLAAGKLLFGHPWYGLLFTTALMCASICWMLQAWIPPTWALLGGMIAVARLGLFSYWINTYSGGGAIAALGGALVLGALPRFMKKPRFRYSLLLAVGVILILTTRPYEGLLLCLPVAFVLVRWMVVRKNGPAPGTLVRLSAVPLALIVAAGAWMGYYDYRVFGNPLTLPYKVNRATYAIAPYYAWQSPRPEPVYRHIAMRDFYLQNELPDLKKLHSFSGFLPSTLIKGARGVLFFSGIALLLPLIMVRRVFADRRIRFLLVCSLVLAGGMTIEIFFIPHYVAPFTAVFYAIGLQCMRHLRFWRPNGQPVGTGLVRFIVTLCFVLAGLRLYAEPLHFNISEWPTSSWTDRWYGPNRFGGARVQIESQLEHAPGKQLVMVRYSPDHNPIDEWVYNAPDIDDAKVIWAREMDAANNLELIHYYKDRNVWLLEPDANPAKLTVYPSLAQETATLR